VLKNNIKQYTEVCSSNGNAHKSKDSNYGFNGVFLFGTQFRTSTLTSVLIDAKII